MNHLLDNPTWHTLSGAHARFSAGTDTARRYARGFSPILGFADNEHPDLAALLPHCTSGEHFYTAGWQGIVPAGWVLQDEANMFRMVWAGVAPQIPELRHVMPLSRHHADEAMALATRMATGPFGPRTLELGDYLGVFEGGRLIAMAGERLQAGHYREISGVCTHPDYQGRGLARTLIQALVRRQLARRETPFLHVMSSATTAHKLYQRVGFRDYSEAVVRVISRL